MTALRALLSTLFIALLIYTSVTITHHGINFLQPFLDEMVRFGWQGQFNFDFMTFLILSGLWTAWRGGFALGAIALGAVAAVFGMTFLASYLLYLSYRTQGDIRTMLLGVHARP